MSLEKLRTEIDLIDQEMLKLFKKRMELSKQIGNFKKVNNLPIFDEKRESEILSKKKLELNDDFLWVHYEKFITNLMNISKEYQNE